MITNSDVSIKRIPAPPRQVDLADVMRGSYIIDPERPEYLFQKLTDVDILNVTTNSMHGNSGWGKVRVVDVEIVVKE